MIYQNLALPPRRKLFGFKSAKIPGDIIPLDQLRARADAQSAEGSGIYFLWRGPQLIYVGQSSAIGQRLAQHTAAREGLSRGKAMPFTRATWIQVEVRDMNRMEGRYICAYLPPFNDKIPAAA